MTSYKSGDVVLLQVPFNGQSTNKEREEHSSSSSDGFILQGRHPRPIFQRERRAHHTL